MSARPRLRPAAPSGPSPRLRPPQTAVDARSLAGSMMAAPAPPTLRSEVHRQRSWMAGVHRDMLRAGSAAVEAARPVTEAVLDLDLLSKGQSLAQATGEQMQRFGRYLAREAPRWHDEAQYATVNLFAPQWVEKARARDADFEAFKREVDLARQRADIAVGLLRRQAASEAAYWDDAEARHQRVIDLSNRLRIMWAPIPGMTQPAPPPLQDPIDPAELLATREPEGAS